VSNDPLQSNWSIPEVLAAVPNYRRTDDGVDLLACRIAGEHEGRAVYLFLYGADPDSIHYDLEESTAVTNERWDGATESGSVNNLAVLPVIVRQWLEPDAPADRSEG